MKPDPDAQLHQRAKEIFFDLMDAPREAWEAAIRERCAGDGVLAKEVSSLLANRGADTDHIAPMVPGDSTSVPAEFSRVLRHGLAEELSSAGEGLESRPSRTRRFAPGDLFAERYEMLSLIGVGGMGEVWRATDKMLGETVALKFVRSSARDRAWIQRLLQETAAARRVSHKNVCRVHDAGEVDGEFFLSMQYVPGLDLAQELRKHGRFKRSASKRLARELVDALVAVHSSGLLHRDLKPANILLDSNRTVHVSDFGLAVSSADLGDEDAKSGTRAYMAPELQRGGSPSQASDVYALGLILYEALTGHRAFQSGEEILAAADNGELPPRPSIFGPSVNPVLEHIVLRCLDPEPEQRPAAEDLQRALALDDPLEAVLSLGDVPTGEVIASSRARPALSPAKTLGIVLATLVFLGLAAWLTRIGGMSPLPGTGPEEMASRARGLLDELGVKRGRFETFSYALNSEPSERGEHVLDDGGVLKGGALRFWYRCAPVPLSPTTAHNQLFGFGKTRLTDPPMDRGGMASVYLDSTGDLIYFRYLPESTPPHEGELPVARLFELAGLDAEDFEPIPPLQPALFQGLHQLAWQSKTEDLRLEVSGTGPQVLSFERLRPVEEYPLGLPTANIGGILNAFLILALFTIAAPRALRHFRSGRGDVWVSLRLAVLCGASLFLAWLTYADYPSDSLDRVVFVMAGVFLCLSSANLIWILSVAVEPHLQRHWPRIYVTWSHLFRGNHRGRGVHSDVLIGLCLGSLPALLQGLAATLGCAPGCAISSKNLMAGVDVQTWLGHLFEAIPGALLLNFEFIAVLAMLGWILRNRAASVIGTGLVASFLNSSSTTSAPQAILAIVSMLLTLYCLLRFGMLASYALILCEELLASTPFPHGAAVWYGPASLATLVLLLLILAWAARPLLFPPREMSPAAD